MIRIVVDSKKGEGKGEEPTVGERSLLQACSVIKTITFDIFYCVQQKLVNVRNDRNGCENNDCFSTGTS